MRILTLFILLSSWALAQSQLVVQIGSTNLVEGETTRLDLIFFNEGPTKQPAEDHSTKDLLIRRSGTQRGYSNGKSFYAYSYTLQPQAIGSTTVPELNFESAGQTISSPSFELNVIPAHALSQLELTYQGKRLDCFTKVFFNKKEFYPGESAYLEYKVYIPRQLNPRDWGQPKIDEQKNCTAFRFAPPSSNQDVSQLRIGDTIYKVGTYRTTFSALKQGQAVFGPITNTLTIAPGQVSGIFGISRRNLRQLEIETPAETFTVLPFPAGKPATFNGAVGEFQIAAEFNKTENISLNDSITATVTIEGAGNLHELQAPTLEDTAHWKVIDVSRVERGEEERKELEGNAGFTYILQPQRGATSLPRFTFSHFNPATKEFYTDTTATAPIELKEPQKVATIVLPEHTVQEESMQDILAPLAEVNLEKAATPAWKKLPVWSWQVLPLSALLLLLLGSVTKKLKQRSTGTVDYKLKQKALKELATCDSSDFLKKAGTYAQQWHPNSPEAARILELRDSQCYQPSDASGVTATQRKELLAQLKKCAITLIAFALFSIQTLQASPDEAFSAWQNGDYKTALDLYEAASKDAPQSADLIYNIGSSHYRLQQPGTAALYFQRALELEPAHVEASKNLEFVQKLQGAIQPKALNSTQQWINELPSEAYRQLSFAGLWLLVLSVVYLRLRKPRGARFGLGLGSAILAPCIALVSLYAWFEHPVRNLTQTGEAAIVLHYTPVLTEPIQADGQELSKKTLINATPSSQCRILATRGNWRYISLANGTRGWVNTDKVEAQ